MKSHVHGSTGLGLTHPEGDGCLLLQPLLLVSREHRLDYVQGVIVKFPGVYVCMCVCACLCVRITVTKV